MLSDAARNQRSRDRHREQLRSRGLAEHGENERKLFEGSLADRGVAREAPGSPQSIASFPSHPDMAASLSQSVRPIPSLSEAHDPVEAETASPTMKAKRLPPREAADRAFQKVQMVVQLLGLERVDFDLADVRGMARRDIPAPLDLRDELKRRYVKPDFKPSQYFSSNLAQMNALIDGMNDDAVAPTEAALDEEEAAALRDISEALRGKKLTMKECHCRERLDQVVADAERAASLAARSDCTKAFAKIVGGSVTMIRAMEINLEDRDKALREIHTANTALKQQVDHLTLELQKATDATAAAANSIQTPADVALFKEAQYLDREHRLFVALRKVRPTQRTTMNAVLAGEFGRDGGDASAGWVKKFVRRTELIHGQRQHIARLERQLMAENDAPARGAPTSTAMQTLNEEDIVGTKAWERKHGAAARSRAKVTARTTPADAIIGTSTLDVTQELAAAGAGEKLPFPITDAVGKALRIAKDCMMQIDQVRVDALTAAFEHFEPRQAAKALQVCAVWQAQLEGTVRDSMDELRPALRAIVSAAADGLQLAKVEGRREATPSVTPPVGQTPLERAVSAPPPAQPPRSAPPATPPAATVVDEDDTAEAPPVELPNPRAEVATVETQTDELPVTPLSPGVVGLAHLSPATPMTPPASTTPPVTSPSATTRPASPTATPPSRSPVKTAKEKPAATAKEKAAASGEARRLASPPHAKLGLKKKPVAAGAKAASGAAQVDAADAGSAAVAAAPRKARKGDTAAVGLQVAPPTAEVGVSATHLPEVDEEDEGDASAEESRLVVHTVKAADELDRTAARVFSCTRELVRTLRTKFKVLLPLDVLNELRDFESHGTTGHREDDVLPAATQAILQCVKWLEAAAEGVGFQKPHGPTTADKAATAELNAAGATPASAEPAISPRALRAAVDAATAPPGKPVPSVLLAAVVADTMKSVVATTPRTATRADGQTTTPRAQREHCQIAAACRASAVALVQSLADVAASTKEVATPPYELVMALRSAAEERLSESATFPQVARSLSTTHAILAQILQDCFTDCAPARTPRRRMSDGRTSHGSARSSASSEPVDHRRTRSKGTAAAHRAARAFALCALRELGVDPDDCPDPARTFLQVSEDEYDGVADESAALMLVGLIDWLGGLRKPAPAAVEQVPPSNAAADSSDHRHRKAIGALQQRVSHLERMLAAAEATAAELADPPQLGATSPPPHVRSPRKSKSSDQLLPVARKLSEEDFGRAPPQRRGTAIGPTVAAAPQPTFAADPVEVVSRKDSLPPRLPRELTPIRPASVPAAAQSPTAAVDNSSRQASPPAVASARGGTPLIPARRATSRVDLAHAAARLPRSLSATEGAADAPAVARWSRPASTADSSFAPEPGRRPIATPITPPPLPRRDADPAAAASPPPRHEGDFVSQDIVEIVRSLRGPERSVVAYEVLGKSVLELHRQVFRVLRLAAARLKLPAVTSATDPLHSVNNIADAFPDVVEVAEHDRRVLDALADMMENDSQAAVSKMQRTFERIKCRLQRKRIVKEIARHKAAPPPSRNPVAALDFLERQQRRLEDHESWLHEQREKTREQQERARRGWDPWVLERASVGGVVGPAFTMHKICLRPRTSEAPPLASESPAVWAHQPYRVAAEPDDDPYVALFKHRVELWLRAKRTLFERRRRLVGGKPTGATDGARPAADRPVATPFPEDARQQGRDRSHALLAMIGRQPAGVTPTRLPANRLEPMARREEGPAGTSAEPASSPAPAPAPRPLKARSHAPASVLQLAQQTFSKQNRQFML